MGGAGASEARALSGQRYQRVTHTFYTRRVSGDKIKEEKSNFNFTLYIEKQISFDKIVGI